MKLMTNPATVPNKPKTLQKHSLSSMPRYLDRCRLHCHLRLKPAQHDDSNAVRIELLRSTAHEALATVPRRHHWPAHHQPHGARPPNQQR